MNNLETVKIILEIGGEPKSFWLMIGDEKQQKEFTAELNNFIKSSDLYSKFEE